MAPDVRAGVLGEDAFPDWNRLVAESPDGSIYSTPEYLDVLCRAAGGRFRVVGAFRGDELAGGVALYERRSPFGAYVAPRLLLYYNGLVLRRYDTKYPSERSSRQVRTLAALEAVMSASGYGGVELRSRATVTDVRPLLARGWSAQLSFSYVVPLLDLKAQWSRVEQNLRRLIDRCAGQGLSAVEDDDFDAFYRLHAATMSRHEVDAYLPRRAFATYFDRLHRAGLCSLYHARLPDGQAIASQLVLRGDHPVSHTVSAANDPAFNRMGAAAFLRWKVFEALAALGHTGNDLTDATLNPVTHFKSQFGGELALSLVLRAPGTRRYRWGSAVVRVYREARATAGTGVRRLLGRSRP
jgi:hypothetical protein